MLSATQIEEKSLDPSIRISLDRLMEVCQEPDAEEGTKPTPYALELARNLMVDAWKEMRCSFPKASPGPGPDGGIRVQWRRPGKEIRLVVPPHEGGRAYIYHETDDAYASEEDVTARSLVHWLRWLAQDE